MNRLTAIDEKHLNTTNLNLLDKRTISTTSLMEILDCGKATAIKIGTSANAKICVGRRILWNTKLIQQYLDDIAV